ncbi:hypothetical protein M422DRAFT_270095 [Sphaerobolus stellatus SS14]|uniref:Uncharacterized protein n=1 Tax=Sphaerobolus stellatus (strain SS14) TaxID=990650 RepID=A0A0C9UI24_SPHS4|nr:hypothetical protein M422DRAFT_270095 [Sphaerobolus stellatus SS14]
MPVESPSFPVEDASNCSRSKIYQNISDVQITMRKRKNFRFLLDTLKYPTVSPFSKSNFRKEDNSLSLQPGILDPISGLRIGAINDSVFLDYLNQVPLELCDPFTSDQEWMEAAAYLGIPGTRTTDKDRYSFDKLVEVFDIAKKQFEYPKSSCTNYPGEQIRNKRR